MLKIIIANTFNKKLKGLIGQKSINYGMLFLFFCSIHTFFMKEPIDIIGLNKNHEVTEIFQSIKPNKILILQKSKHVLELPNHFSNNIKLGDIIDGNAIK